MFNILPQIDISSVCSWEKIVALCVYMVCKTALIITALIVICYIVKYITTLIFKKNELKHLEEIKKNSFKKNNNE